MFYNRIHRLVLLIVMMIVLLYPLGFALGIMSLSSAKFNKVQSFTPTLIWETTANLVEPIIYLSAETLKVGDREFVYLIGGEVNEENTTRVYFAEVLSNGTLSSWQPTAEISAKADLSFYNTAVVGEQLYVIGGSDEVLCAAPLSNGDINAWIPTTSLSSLTNFSTAVVNDRIYIIGGWLDGNPQSQVYSGKTSSSCGPIQWTPEPSLPYGLSHTAAGSVVDDLGNGIIVVIGGWITPDTQRAILSAPVHVQNNSITLGEWKPVGHIETGIIFHSLSVLKDEIFVIGGTPDDTFVSPSIFRMQIKDDEVTNVITSELPLGIQKHDSVVIESGQIYLFGGERVTKTNGLQDYSVASLFTPLAWISKDSHTSDVVMLGDQIKYTLYYTNNGLRPLTNVVITDEIPANTFLVDSSYPPDTRVITWTIPVLDMNLSGTETFTVQVLPPLTAVPTVLSTSSPTATPFQPDSGLQCSTAWAGGGGSPRPTCTPTSTPIPLPTTPAPPAPTSTAPGSTRIYDLTPVPVVNRAWLCEGDWCTHSNYVLNTPYHFYLPLVFRQ